MQAIWNQAVAGSRIRAIGSATGRRRATMLARLRDSLGGDLAAWRAFVTEKVTASAFLRNPPPNPKHPKWKCDIDFVIGHAFDKIMDGKYTDGADDGLDSSHPNEPIERLDAPGHAVQSRDELEQSEHPLVTAYQLVGRDIFVLITQDVGEDDPRMISAEARQRQALKACHAAGHLLNIKA
jgi:hypothetical protein